MDNPFLASMQQEGRIDKPVEPHEEKKETPPAPPAETKPDDNKPASSPEDKGEGGTPPESKPDETKEPVVFEAFHKHPRWLALQQELSELREFREKVTPLLDRFGEKPNVEETPEVPEWFIDLFGENQAAWKKYRAYTADERKRLREEILGEIRSQQSHAQQETKKWDKWVDSEVQILEAEGFKFNRNELLKIALEYAPTDESGNISLRKAYGILQALQAGKPQPKPPTEKKKEIAGQTMQRGKPDEAPKGFKTSKDFQGKSFADLIPRE